MRNMADYLNVSDVFSDLLLLPNGDVGTFYRYIKGFVRKIFYVIEK